MDENTQAQGGDGTEESSVIKTLRAEEAKAKAEAKRLADELMELQSERAQSRQAQLDAAVNGRNYPEAVVATLKAQVEAASSDEFAKLLQDLGSSGDETEGVQAKEEEQVAPSTAPDPASLGQQVAAAAAGGGGEVDVMKDLATAATPEELYAKAAEHGLDKF